MAAASRKTILINGPRVEVGTKGEGVGIGGATRSVQLYLQGFELDEVELAPCYNSVRRKSRFYILAFPLRLINDTLRALRLSLSASGIHIIGHYENAVYREFCIARACALTDTPVLYHMKAGVFIDWYESAGALQRWLIRKVLRGSKVILCEGEIYVDYLRRELGIEGRYLPNCVLESEVPAEVPVRLEGDGLRVCFVGYCYEGKGVFELVKGCRLAAERGLAIELSLVGREEPAFAAFLDALDGDAPGLEIRRFGGLAHDEAMDVMGACDVFCMPTRHSGEGHSNAINEAMMMGMVIVSTRHGFLESVLGEGCSYFLDALTPDDIAEKLAVVDRDRDEARRRAGAARRRLQERFTSAVVFPQLAEHYRDLVGGR